jgi:DNA modification methylase
VKRDMSDSLQRQRIDRKYQTVLKENLRLGQLVSYVGNKKVPVLRLYRYKEAFALDFVRYFIRHLGLSSKDYLLDPYAGMGTTLFTSMLHGIPSIGVDKLPMASFLAGSLHDLVFLRRGQLKTAYDSLKSRVDEVEPSSIPTDVKIMKLAFEERTLLRLRRWKAAIDQVKEPLKNVFLLLFFSILEDTSYTSKDGQFLRIKREKKTVWPDDALRRKVEQAEVDVQQIRWLFPRWNGSRDCLPQIVTADSMELSSVRFKRPPTALITSPPYPNRYDYTRSYCLELCFHFVKTLEELKNLRFSILRSHIESKQKASDSAVHPVVEEAVNALRGKKLNNPKIPTMLLAYFNDMNKCIGEFARCMEKGGKAVIVVDNVRFEGEHIPVDLVLSDLAEKSGFTVKEIIVARYKGNSSQQMRKYGRLPVRESVAVWRKN